MKESFRDSAAGDQLSASEYTRVKDAVEKLANEAAMSGEGSLESNVGGLKGRAIKKAGTIHMVRLTSDVVPRNSSHYAALEELNLATDGFNAVLQIWDTEEHEWADTPSLERLLVMVGDDGHGWRPLVKDDILPVVWHKDAQAFVPLEKRETAVVVITSGPDDQGYYSGTVVEWDSEEETWTTGNECYIVDVGSL